MPKIDASKYGSVSSGFESTFNAARTTGATAVNQSVASNTTVSQYFRDSGKGGTNYKITRFFCAFDTSSYSSGYTISNLKFHWRNSAGTTCSPAICFPAFIIVKSTAQGNADTNLSSSDFYSDVDFSTAYSSSTNLSTSAGDSSITLNSTAITAFGTDLLKLVVLQYGNDYANAGGMSDLTQKMNANFASGSSGYIPYIEFDAVVSGYGNDVSGVSSDDIASVNSVATANISQIIGV